MQRENSEELVSAERRTFVVALQPKLGGTRAPMAQVLLIKAYSVGEAKRKAVKQVATGRFKHWNRLSLYNFTSVEDANAKKAKTETSDGQSS